MALFPFTGDKYYALGVLGKCEYEYQSGKYTDQLLKAKIDGQKNFLTTDMEDRKEQIDNSLQLWQQVNMGLSFFVPRILLRIQWHVQSVVNLNPSLQSKRAARFSRNMKNVVLVLIVAKVAWDVFQRIYHAKTMEAKKAIVQQVVMNYIMAFVMGVGSSIISSTTDGPKGNPAPWSPKANIQKYCSDVWSNKTGYFLSWTVRQLQRPACKVMADPEDRSFPFEDAVHEIFCRLVPFLLFQTFFSQHALTAGKVK